MAEENQNKIPAYDETTETETPQMKKEGEKPQKEVIIAEFEKVKVSEPSETKVEAYKEEDSEKKPSLLEKLHRTSSNSSSSGDEEEGEAGEEKKKKKKEKKELNNENLGGEKEEGKHEENTTVPVKKCEAEPIVDASADTAHPEDKKGFLEKIKEKLPGQQKKAEESPASEDAATEPLAHEGEAKEKKGILEKIKDKLPGYYPKTEEEKEKEEESAAY